MDVQSAKKELKRKNSRRIYIICGVLLVAILLLDLSVPLGVAVVILYNAVVLLALKSNERRLIIGVSILATFLTISLLFVKDQVDGMWKVVSNRGLAVFFIWVEAYLGLQRQSIQEKREAALEGREKALQEVRVLRGFLPICASCKKIRDLQGSWTLMEKYISEHSEAEFSHGLCPECTGKLFPHLFKKRHDPDTP